MKYLKNNENNRLISVIVPAFNVEMYIEKCIKSIQNQTYKNIEIVIIDDGSDDSTSYILDELAMLDSRISVFHNSNAGVSAARNFGIKHANGYYLVFVDGDDYLSNDYLEYMLYLMTETNSDFCLSKKCYISNNEAQVLNDKIECINSNEGIALLLSPEVTVGCWNKMYKKSLIEDNKLEFSTNLFYGEGLSFITQVAMKSQRIGVGSKKVYYYRRNNDSSATTLFNIKKLINGEKALLLINSSLPNSKKINIMFTLHYTLFSLGALVRINKNKVRKKYRKEYAHWKKVILKNLWTILLSRDISLYRKFLILGGCICPKVITVLDSIRIKKIQKNSVG